MRLYTNAGCIGYSATLQIEKLNMAQNKINALVISEIPGGIERMTRLKVRKTNFY